MGFRYSDKVIQNFQNPQNVGEIENPSGESTEGSFACGDMITMQLKVEDNIIKDIKFRSYGCASNIATASVITQLAKGKTVEEARKISWKDVADELDGLPPAKVHCSVLAVDTLKAALDDYDKRRGIIKHESLSAAAVRKKLMHVIHPERGMNLITLKMVDDVSVNDGNVVIKLSKIDESYQEHIEDEIKEHIAELPEVKEINILFI